MSWILINTFNENDGTTVRDYSESSAVPSPVSGTPTADTEGYYWDLDGTQYYEFQAADVTFQNTVSIYFEIWADANTGTDFIWDRQSFGSLTYDGTDIIWNITGGTNSTCTLTYPGVSEWVRGVATWDSTNGTNLWIMDDTGALTTDSDATTPAPSAANDIFTGADNAGANGFDGRIRIIALNDAEATRENVLAWMANTQGQRLNGVANGFALADLLRTYQDLPSKIVVTFHATDYLLFFPMNSNTPPENSHWQRIGNKWTTTRQDCILSLDTDPPQRSVYDGNNKHSDLDATTNIVELSDKNGTIWKTVTVDDAAYTVVQQDAAIGIKNMTAARTFTLPSSPRRGEKHRIYDEDGSCGTYNLTIDGNGNNIIGSATIALSSAYADADLIFNGTNWNA